MKLSEKRLLRTKIAMWLLAVAVLSGGRLFAGTIISLDQNNLGINGNLGTVTLMQVNPNSVQVSVDFSAYATQINADKTVDFQTDIAGLAASNVALVSLTAGGTLYNATPTSFSFKSGSPGGAGTGTFEVELGSFDAGQPNGTAGATEIVFDVNATGITPGSFVDNASGNIFAVHFCTSTASSCGPSTGWAWGGPETPTPPPSSVPEPGSMLLLGTGLTGFAAFLRKRKNAN